MGKPSLAYWLTRLLSKENIAFDDVAIALSFIMLRSLLSCIPGVTQKSGTLDFRYFDIFENIVYFKFMRYRTLSSENNDTKINEICWVVSGAAPGCLLRGGKISREPNYFAPALKKSLSGGDWHIFFFRLQIILRGKKIHNGVGVLSWPWPTAELTSKKKLKS